jgi:cytochrome c5
MHPNRFPEPKWQAAAFAGRMATALAAGLALAGAAPAADRPAAEVVKMQCAHCHEAGTANAPKIGDAAAWVPRLKDGVEPLVYAAIRGHGGMPPRGGRADLTDSELRAAVLYMYHPAGIPKDVPRGAALPVPPGAGPKRVTAGGLDVYFGSVSAERLRDFPPTAAERKLHGGIPSGSGYHHVNISVYEAGTQSPIADARVTLDVTPVGRGGDSVPLEAVTISGGKSYGNYVRLLPKTEYVFVARITRPGAPEVDATFRDRTN